MKASAVYLRNQQLLPCERTAELFRDLLLRELKFVEGQHRQAWAKEMSAFLLFAKARARATLAGLRLRRCKSFNDNIIACLQKVFRANPPRPGEPPRRGLNLAEE